MMAHRIRKISALILYTEKYILASCSNSKIAESLFIDRGTEKQKGQRICRRDLHPLGVKLKFPAQALCYNQNVNFSHF